MRRVVLEYVRERGWIAGLWLAGSGVLQLLRGMSRGYWLVFIGRGVRIAARSRVQIGRFTRIEDFVELDGFGRQGLRIGSRCKIGKYSVVKVPPSPHVAGEGISIGDGTAFAEFCFVGGAAMVQIGEGCAIGQYVSIHPQDHLPWSSEGTAGGVRSQGIEISGKCWIGAKATMLDGSRIGERCIVAAAAVVRGRFADGVLIAGVPGVVKRSLYAAPDHR
jgi:acetyltransferase-like isoleucine patch superfamily enzyme